jgi:hypothetical protein
VVALHPVGEKPAVLIPDEWTGSWLVPDGVLTIRVIDPGKGIIEALFIDDEKKDALLEKYTIHLFKSGDFLFASTKDSDHPDPIRYLWGLMRKDDRRIMIWLPEEDKFRDLVAKGTIPGTSDKDKVTLGDLKSEQLKLLSSKDAGNLYDWSEPIVLIKLGK